MSCFASNPPSHILSQEGQKDPLLARPPGSRDFPCFAFLWCAPQPEYWQQKKLGQSECSHGAPAESRSQPPLPRSFVLLVLCATVCPTAPSCGRSLNTTPLFTHTQPSGTSLFSGLPQRSPQWRSRGMKPQHLLEPDPLTNLGQETQSESVRCCARCSSDVGSAPLQ